MIFSAETRAANIFPSLHHRHRSFHLHRSNKPGSTLDPAQQQQRTILLGQSVECRITSTDLALVIVVHRLPLLHLRIQNVQMPAGLQVQYFNSSFQDLLNVCLGHLCFNQITICQTGLFEAFRHLQGPCLCTCLPTEGGIGGIGRRNCLVCWLVRNQQPKKYKRHRSHLKTLFVCLVALSFGFSVFCFNSNIPIQPPIGCTMDRPTLHDQTVHSTSCTDVFVPHAQGLTVMLLEEDN